MRSPGDWRTRTKRWYDTANLLMASEGFDADFAARWTNGPLLVRADTGRFLRESDLFAGGRSHSLFARSERDTRLLAYDATRGDWVALDAAPALRADCSVTGVDGAIACSSAFALFARAAADYPPRASRPRRPIARSLLSMRQLRPQRRQRPGRRRRVRRHSRTGIAVGRAARQGARTRRTSFGTCPPGLGHGARRLSGGDQRKTLRPRKLASKPARRPSRSHEVATGSTMSPPRLPERGRELSILSRRRSKARTISEPGN
jgi:hypothetical protein